VSELLKLINNLKDTKSPEAYNTGPKLVKKSDAVTVEPFVYWYNKCCSSGCVPDKMKIEEVVPTF
jgi:exo-beta-1,3-glucanase (GH17 family)